MRRVGVLVVAAAIAGFVVQAAAAAEPARKAPALSAYNWSGFYIGANAGYGWASADWTNKENVALFADYLPGETLSHRISGLIGGVQLGYNFQKGPWVFGIDATLDASVIEGRARANTLFGANDDNFETRVRALMLATGRAGYAWDNVLAYAKAGIALANVKTSVSDTAAPTTGAGTDSNWLSGPTVGLGFEYGLSPNVSIGVEYDYIRLNSGTYQLGDTTGSYLWDVDVRNISVVMLRFNYRFAALR